MLDSEVGGDPDGKTYWDVLYNCKIDSPVTIYKINFSPTGIKTESSFTRIAIKMPEHIDDILTYVQNHTSGLSLPIGNKFYRNRITKRYLKNNPDLDRTSSKYTSAMLRPCCVDFVSNAEKEKMIQKIKRSLQ